MGVNYRVQVIYQEAMESVTKSEKRWKDMLRLAGKLYRYEFDNIKAQVDLIKQLELFRVKKSNQKLKLLVDGM